jgi:sphingomyelin phosphodiesterase
VHIIGHIDPSKCLESWSKNFYSIVNRYESTITAQFFGHTHKDEIKIFYDITNQSRAVSIGYLAPSVTTEAYLNPGYRIYTLDANHEDATMQIVDHETWIMNLTQANELGEPKWFREYSAQEAFGLEDLSPQAWTNLVDEMLADLDGVKVRKAVEYYSKSSDDFPKCDLECRKSLICGFKQSRSDNFINC